MANAILLIQSISYSQNNATNYEGKVYLHVDRDIYNLGEDIFYKAYIVETKALTRKAFKEAKRSFFGEPAVSVDVA